MNECLMYCQSGPKDHGRCTPPGEEDVYEVLVIDSDSDQGRCTPPVILPHVAENTLNSTLKDHLDSTHLDYLKEHSTFYNSCK